jgi:DNA-directed RNA polymerase subunit L
MSKRVANMGVLKYLVLKKLAGKEHYLHALYEYLMNNASPAVLERKYNINRRLIASMKQRIREKNSVHGMEIARRAIQVILETPMPQLTLVGDGEIHFYCRACGREFRGIYPEDHIAKKHGATLKYYTILVKLRIRGGGFG